MGTQCSRQPGCYATFISKYIKLLNDKISKHCNPIVTIMNDDLIVNRFVSNFLPR